MIHLRSAWRFRAVAGQVGREEASGEGGDAGGRGGGAPGRKRFGGAERERGKITRASSRIARFSSKRLRICSAAARSAPCDARGIAPGRQRRSAAGGRGWEEAQTLDGEGCAFSAASPRLRSRSRQSRAGSRVRRSPLRAPRPSAPVREERGPRSQVRGFTGGSWGGTARQPVSSLSEAKARVGATGSCGGQCRKQLSRRAIVGRRSRARRVGRDILMFALPWCEGLGWAPRPSTRTARAPSAHIVDVICVCASSACAQRARGS